MDRQENLHQTGRRQRLRPPAGAAICTLFPTFCALSPPHGRGSPHPYQAWRHPLSWLERYARAKPGALRNGNGNVFLDHGHMWRGLLSFGIAAGAPLCSSGWMRSAPRQARGVGGGGPATPHARSVCLPQYLLSKRLRAMALRSAATSFAHGCTLGQGVPQLERVAWKAPPRNKTRLSRGPAVQIVHVNRKLAVSWKWQDVSVKASWKRVARKEPS